MALLFSRKLKEFRRARNLTQEEIARTFNVSPQTVSRWETGVNLPDIEMLPPLAEFFCVTTDDLLGVDMVHKRAKAKQYREAVHEKYREAAWDEAVAIARKGVAELPNGHHLLSWLARALLRKTDEKSLREAIAIHKRIIEEGPNEPGDCTKADSMQSLVLACNLAGEKEKAMEYAKALPFYTSEVMRWVVLEGEEKLAKTIENLEIFANLMLEHVEVLEEPGKVWEEVGGVAGLYREIAERLEKMME